MLRWSINLFRIFGIQLAVHASFVLLLAYYGIEGWQSGGLVGMLWKVGLILSFFVCVVLHELGHSLTAMRFGVRVSRILLLPIGGMAEFDRIPTKPSTELLITIAGPAVNFVLAGVLFPFFGHALLDDVTLPPFGWQEWGVHLLLANLVMGTFNLLPVFPMDGGRIFRALLAMRLSYLRATYWASTVGKYLALILAGFAALYFDAYLLAALLLFIFYAGDAEYRMLLLREQQAARWAEIAKRVAAAGNPGDDEPPAPPRLMIHDPN
jgi:Zn-dependent protease